jgi:superfamily I DNA/RNA helicase
VDGYKSVVKRYYNKLTNELNDDNNYSVQCYISGDREFHYNKLNFEATNTVTILNKMSAKGTEFDVVYYVGLESQDYHADDGFVQKMAVYVMSSRPRNKLTICISGINNKDDLPSVIKIFPKTGSDLCRYIGLGDLPSVMTFD